VLWRDFVIPDAVVESPTVASIRVQYVSVWSQKLPWLNARLQDRKKKPEEFSNWSVN
jgi:hypothetical protein